VVAWEASGALAEDSVDAPGLLQPMHRHFRCRLCLRAVAGLEASPLPRLPTAARAPPLVTGPAASRFLLLVVADLRACRVLALVCQGRTASGCSRQPHASGARPGVLLHGRGQVRVWLVIRDAVPGVASHIMLSRRVLGSHTAIRTGQGVRRVVVPKCARSSSTLRRIINQSSRDFEFIIG